MTATAGQLLDDLADLLVPRLEERGFVRSRATSVEAFSTNASSAYDKATCERFLEGAHLGDSVLRRAEVFFGELAKHGEITSLEVVEALNLKGPKSVPANLTNPLKKSSRRLDIEEPWEEALTADGTRTVWRDRDGIAARMVEEIAAEWKRRDPSQWNPSQGGEG